MAAEHRLHEAEWIHKNLIGHKGVNGPARFYKMLCLFRLYYKIKSTETRIYTEN